MNSQCLAALFKQNTNDSLATSGRLGRSRRSCSTTRRRCCSIFFHIPCGCRGTASRRAPDRHPFFLGDIIFLALQSEGALISHHLPSVFFGQLTLPRLHLGIGHTFGDTPEPDRVRVELHTFGVAEIPGSGFDRLPVLSMAARAIHVDIFRADKIWRPSSMIFSSAHHPAGICLSAYSAGGGGGATIGPSPPSPHPATVTLNPAAPTKRAVLSHAMRFIESHPLLSLPIFTLPSAWFSAASDDQPPISTGL